MKKIVNLIILIAMTVYISGCGVSRIALKPDFWEKNDQKIGVAILEYPEAGAHRQGSEGLLDMAINSALSQEMGAYLKNIEIDIFEDVADIFVSHLQEKNYQAKVLKEKIVLEKVSGFKPEGSGNFLKVDVRFMGKKNDIDKLILLGVDRYGTLRKYYGFIPLGAPQALFQVTGQMIDLKTNEKQWLVKMKENESTVRIVGKWNQPSDYPNLTKAIVTAIKKAKKYLVNSFFNENLMEKQVRQ